MSSILELPDDKAVSVIIRPPLSDREFEELCAANSNLNLEQTKEGEIVVNAPASSGTSDGNAEIVTQLRVWWKTHRRGKTYESSVGIILPDGSKMSPDAAYATESQIEGLTGDDIAHFLKFVPAFIIELRSPSDSVRQAQAKMEQWIANGAELAWLIDPRSETVSIYKNSADVFIDAGLAVRGTGPVDGFVLDVKEVWSAYKPKS